MVLVLQVLSVAQNVLIEDTSNLFSPMAERYFRAPLAAARSKVICPVPFSYV